MSLLARLNLNYLRIFLVVYRTRSMTLAAKQLHLTQSGVSQQIKSLEDTLGITLFDRINRKIIPTSEAELLYLECSRRLDELENTLRQISKQDDELLGRVRVGISPSLQSHNLIQALARFGNQHNKMKFDFKIGSAADISAWFESGRLDFAIVDAFVTEANLDYDEISSEPYVLVAHESLLQNRSNVLENFDDFCQLPFVQYMEAQEMLNAWFKKNWGRLPKEINVRINVMDIQACLSFVQNGIAIGLLPESILSDKFLTEQQLQRITLKSPVSNRIRVAYLHKRTMGLSARLCLQWVRDTLAQENLPQI